MALEFIKNGSLLDLLNKNGWLLESEARYYFQQLIDAIEYIHELGYSHRDIKPDNILLDDDFNIKLIDFGFATKSSKSKSFRGTPEYMLPEILMEYEYDPKQSDLFSAAITLFILIANHSPFKQAKKDDWLYKLIINKNYDEFWRFHSSYQGKNIDFSDDFKELFISMINPSTVSRYSIKQIKKHQWFIGIVPDEDDLKRKFSKYY